MKTDRELLELAAKAANMDVRHWNGGECHIAPRTGWPFPTVWNPLKSKDDALGLAVKMHMTVRCYMGSTCAQIGVPGRPNAYCEESDHANPEAATCRAIVRAAAEVGKQP